MLLSSVLLLETCELVLILQGVCNAGSSRHHRLSVRPQEHSHIQRRLKDYTHLQVVTRCKVHIMEGGKLWDQPRPALVAKLEASVR